MGHGRQHNREFKLAVVRDIMRGDRRPADLCRELGLSAPMVCRWRREVAERGEEAFLPLVPKEADLAARRIAELERLVGRLTLENEALKKGLQDQALRSVTR
ncbi:MAG TPA: transposase [Thermomicrobiales bacterium]|nr:transposase [Thermomicrobiales bacterium]